VSENEESGNESYEKESNEESGNESYEKESNEENESDVNEESGDEDSENESEDDEKYEKIKNEPSKEKKQKRIGFDNEKTKNSFLTELNKILNITTSNENNPILDQNKKIMIEIKETAKKSHEKIVKQLEDHKLLKKSHKAPDLEGKTKEEKLKRIAEDGVLKLFKHIQEKKKILKQESDDSNPAIDMLFKETKGAGQNINWSVLNNNLINE
jgi:hypothetical protein